MKKFIISVFIAVLSVLLIWTTNDISANGSGKTGRTKKNSSAGCGSCHIHNSSNTSQFTIPDTVIAGQSYNNFQLTITAASASGLLGCNIAVKYGTLSAVAGSGLKLYLGELTQSSGISYSNPKVINFGYTAPNTACIDTVYGVAARGYTGGWEWTPVKTVMVINSTGIINNEIPANYYLKQNFPNPFNPETKILYGIKNKTNVRIDVFDITGKLRGTLVNETQAAGNYEINFDISKYGMNLSSGIYYYRISADKYIETKKMILVK